MALQKSGEEFEKYKLEQVRIEKEQSLKEIEQDIKKLEKAGTLGNSQKNH